MEEDRYAHEEDLQVVHEDHEEVVHQEYHGDHKEVFLLPVVDQLFCLTDLSLVVGL